MPQHTSNQHLVLGAGGAQGAAISSALVRQGENVKGLVRSESSKVPQGVEKVVGNLGDLKSLDAAFKGVTHLSITIPLVYDSTIVSNYTRNIVNAAVKVGVKRLVFNANIRLPRDTTGVAAFDTRIEANSILRSCDIPMICLQPAVYLENLLAPGVLSTMREIGELHYPLPADIKVSWISHVDLANSVSAAHKLSTIPTQPICIGSNPMNGSELAAELSAATGRELSYIPLDPNTFEQSLAGFIGAQAAAGVAGLYHWAFKNSDSTLFGDNDSELNKPLGVTTLSPQEWSVHQPWSVAVNRA